MAAWRLIVLHYFKLSLPLNSLKTRVEFLRGPSAVRIILSEPPPETDPVLRQTTVAQRAACSGTFWVG